jgi:hypothetical protein
MDKRDMWLGLLLAMASACSTEQSRLDSSTNLISGPKNQLHVLTLEVPGTCAQARRRIEARGVSSAPEDGLLLMQVMQCQNREANAATPSRPSLPSSRFGR